LIASFASQSSFTARVGAAIGLAAFADFLFYDHTPGITFFLFAIALAIVVLAVNPAGLDGRSVVFKAGGLLVALLPLVENVSLLSLAIAIVALAVFALSVAGRLRRGVARVARQVVIFLLVMPFRFIRDLVRWTNISKRSGRRTVRGSASMAVWLMPLVLASIFIWLFGMANPVIESWLAMIDLLVLLDLLELARMALWVLVIVIAWAFLRPRLLRFSLRLRLIPADAAKPIAEARPATLAQTVFGRAAILRALILFNGLFAVQTMLDAAYLWGGVALPEGLSYAAYAHRGAYPLVATALLAAGFVLAALRPGSATSSDPLIRRLVYLWVAQNIVLVVSSILRLDLYIGVYSLTYWRIAAFIWMGLVATGLALIIARIATGRSNEWLLSANLLTLSATLYVSGFVNFAGLIAGYNVRHSLEFTGQGTSLDTYYLRFLGPDAFPAIDRVLAREDLKGTATYEDLATMRRVDGARYLEHQREWRTWTFRDRRLVRYLETAPPPPSGTAIMPYLR